MRGAWPDETVRLLENWAMWLANDRRPVEASSQFPAYRLSSRGKRAGNVIPIISIEAERADAIVRTMVPRYQQPLKMHYLWTVRSDASKALACNCCVNTYKALLDEAHTLFDAEWYTRRVCNSLTVSV